MNKEQLEALEFVYESAAEYLETFDYDSNTEQNLLIVKELIEQQKKRD